MALRLLKVRYLKGQLIRFEYLRSLDPRGRKNIPDEHSRVPF